MLGKLKLLWHSLFIGMKSVDVLLSGNQKDGENSNYEIPENGGGGVYKDLLEQKITQEVEELRYSSYHVAKESKKYRYVGNGKALKKTESQLTERHVKLDESDGLPIILIQDNNVICEDVYETLKEVNKKNNKKCHTQYDISITRDIVPRFRLEDYARKVVVKDAGENYVIDVYCSMYPRQFSERKDRSFISEIKKIKTGYKKSDVIDFQKIYWVTRNAWGADDWMKYVFIDFELHDIIEFDGNYILRFGCQSEVFGENLLDKIYSASAEKKYKEKSVKNGRVIQLFQPEQEIFELKDDDVLRNLSGITFDVENAENNE